MSLENLVSFHYCKSWLKTREERSCLISHLQFLYSWLLKVKPKILYVGCALLCPNKRNVWFWQIINVVCCLHKSWVTLVTRSGWCEPHFVSMMFCGACHYVRCWEGLLVFPARPPFSQPGQHSPGGWWICHTDVTEHPMFPRCPGQWCGDTGPGGHPLIL